MKLLHPKNNRGIALLIVLLVTALLISLVFEFAYATRISLNSAVNLRDSERAYFLALTGINAFKSPNAQKLRDMIPQGKEEPFSPDEGLTVIMLKWVSESGKIKITDVKTDPIVQSMVQNLLEYKQIDADVYRRMVDPGSDINKLTLLSGLRQYMSDEEFRRLNVEENFTLGPVEPHKININSASVDVLVSMGISQGAAEQIVKDREGKAFTADDINSERINGISGIKIPPATGNFIKTYLTSADGSVFKYSAHATVGGYTKQVEAIMKDSTIYYWKAL